MGLTEVWKFLVLKIIIPGVFFQSWSLGEPLIVPFSVPSETAKENLEAVNPDSVGAVRIF